MDERDFVGRTQAIKHKLYRVTCSLLRQEADREDAVQAALFRAWQKRGTLRQPEYFETWLIRILINECRNIQRQGMRPDRPLAESLLSPEPQDRDLHDAVMALPEKYRLVIALHYIDGYPVLDVSRMLGIPKGTVMWRLSQARKLLKGKLEEAAL